MKLQTLKTALDWLSENKITVPSYAVVAILSISAPFSISPIIFSSPTPDYDTGTPVYDITDGTLASDNPCGAFVGSKCHHAFSDNSNSNTSTVAVADNIDNPANEENNNPPYITDEDMLLDYLSSIDTTDLDKQKRRELVQFIFDFLNRHPVNTESDLAPLDMIGNFLGRHDKGPGMMLDLLSLSENDKISFYDRDAFGKSLGYVINVANDRSKQFEQIIENNPDAKDALLSAISDIFNLLHDHNTPDLNSNESIANYLDRMTKEAVLFSAKVPIGYSQLYYETLDHFADTYNYHARNLNLPARPIHPHDLAAFYSNPQDSASFGASGFDFNY